jgi:uncharacterized metal-binding protein YceD (DUF177 family)
MNIPFRRITKIPQEFEISSEGVTLKGTLTFKGRNLVTMNAHLSGKLQLPCDICAEQFDMPVEEELDLLLSDGVYEGSEDNFDVVEMDGVIDMDEIIHSEIELIRSDYHSCNNCIN